MASGGGNIRRLVIVLGLLGVVLIARYLRRHRHLIPSTIPAGGEHQPVSSCMTCHGDMMGLIPAHRQAGCQVCHLGHPEASDREAAHRDMILIPGNLSNAPNTCGRCHPGINERVKRSLMRTMSGIIRTTQAVFGEDTTDAAHINRAPPEHSAATSYLRQRCASCHLGNEKINSGPVDDRSRGGGCLACHLQYDRTALRAFFFSRINDTTMAYHPALSVNATDEHCFGCHSRSGRIAPSYEGYHETLHPDTTDEIRTLDDGRSFRYISDDVHHAAGMACIDCHDHLDVMGDGSHYTTKHQAVHVRCTDCHTTATVVHRAYHELDDISRRLIRLRHQDTAREYVITPSGRVVTNLFVSDGRLQLRTKIDGKFLSPGPPAPACTAPVHRDLTCNACHTRWAPRCITCHVSYDDGEEQWQERAGLFRADPPTLGVIHRNGRRQITTFVPGMIMHLDKRNFTGRRDDTVFVRRFVPIAAHTIARNARTCRSCHWNPLALGYGRGRIISDGDDTRFEPSEALESDSLPLDAWIRPFTGPSASSSRAVHPFSAGTQRRILDVGRCLQCHDGDSPAMQSALKDFAQAAAHHSKRSGDKYYRDAPLKIRIGAPSKANGEKK